MRGAVLNLIAWVPAVQRQSRPLALLEQQRVQMPVLRIVPAHGSDLVLGGRKQEMVWNVFVALGALLGQVIHPSQSIQRRPDEVLLSGGTPSPW